jgi:hypothetical protein
MDFEVQSVFGLVERGFSKCFEVGINTKHDDFGEEFRVLGVDVG